MSINLCQQVEGRRDEREIIS